MPRFAFMASAVVPYLVTGKALARTGNTGYSGQPTAAVFTARDGRYLSLGVVQQGQFELLARKLNRAEWLEDPRFRNPHARRENAAAVFDAVSGVLGTRDAAEWERDLSAAGIPCGMVREVEEAMSLEGLAARSLRLPLEIPGLPDREDVGIVGLGVLDSLTDAEGLGPPPRHGEHTGEVLRWLDEA